MQPLDVTAAGFDPQAYLRQLTGSAGVYQMLGAKGEVLYVGKARNLKNRVASYFRASGLTAKTMAMVARIADIRVTVTSSETEALLLEQSLIKQCRPPFNIVLRDDKSYPWIRLTEDDTFPRLCFHRGSRKRKGRYFGPYPSAGAVRESLNVLQKLFRIRQCDDTYFANRTRPCLQYQIKRCSAPCVDLIDPEDYADDVRHAVLFLEGRNEVIVDEFKEAMEAAAGRLEFERAARYRDRIKMLQRVQENQYVISGDGDVDVVALARQPAGTCVQVLFIRGGRLLGDKTWFPRDELDSGGAEILSAFLSQFYLGNGQGAADLPRQILLSQAPADEDLIADALRQQAGRRVGLAVNVRGQRARWLELATRNAEQSLNAHVTGRKNVLERFEALQQALDLPALPERLECFDVSHTRGEATVASCVVFDTEGPRKTDYRRFNIEDVTPGDDYAAMAQALRRRYTRLKAGEGKLPDILVIDGGRGQLAQAETVLTELQVEGVLVLGIAKGADRRPGLETLFLSGRATPLAVEGHSPAMNLLQHIRDEAHRFAITGHRNRRGKARTSSELEDIDGIGPRRRRALLAHFGGLRGVRGASIEELARVPGVSRHLAQQIYEALHDG
jgi:excinuclease ABC subunit C